MPFNLPQRRINQNKIQIPRRRVPIEQIVETYGKNPLATGIETAGNVLGQALAKKAELRRQGKQLSILEKGYGLQPDELSGLDPELAVSFGKYVRESRKIPTTPLPKLQFAGLDEAGNPVSFNPAKNALEIGTRAAAGGALLPKQKKILPGSVLEDIKNQESAISLLENAVNTAPKIMARSVGLIGGVVAPKVAKIPVLGKPFRDPKRAVFQQNVKTGFLKFLYSEAGKQLSDPERIAVQEAIGSVDTPIEEFKPKLDGAIVIMREAQQRYLQSLGESGYVSPFIKTRKSTAVPTERDKFIQGAIQKGYSRQEAESLATAGGL